MIWPFFPFLMINWWIRRCAFTSILMIKSFQPTWPLTGLTTTRLTNDLILIDLSVNNNGRYNDKPRHDKMEVSPRLHDKAISPDTTYNGTEASIMAFFWIKICLNFTYQKVGKYWKGEMLWEMDMLTYEKRISPITPLLCSGHWW